MNKILTLGLVAASFNIQYAHSSSFSGDMTLTSDYLFNGVSQTQGNPALQFNGAISSENGSYAGVFVSNVDFDDDTNLELDAYVGWYADINDDWNVELSALYYSYHGAGYSADFNYPEAMLAVGYRGFRLATWYSWDYFGTGARHVVTSLTYTRVVNWSAVVEFGYARSQSLDGEKYQWDDSRAYDNIYTQLTIPWRAVNFGGALSYAALDSDWQGGSRANIFVNYVF